MNVPAALCSVGASLALFVVPAPAHASADAPPRGTLLELHSCEVYAGGCTVSSQATLEGNYLLKVWSFKGGRHTGVELAGLKLAALQSSGENLAAPKSAPNRTVLYLPSEATDEQRAALRGWYASASGAHSGERVETRVLPLELKSTVDGCVFRAGDLVSVQTAALESCETRSCGEALWYTPRSATTVFTVALNKVSEVREPMLGLVWRDATKRSVFLGRFGEGSPRPAYVAAAELCGPGKSLF